MANSGSGYIIRGVATERLSRAEEEVVSNVQPIPAAKAHLQQHRSIVKTWCYPQVRGIDFHSFGLSYEKEPEHAGADLVVASARERCLWLRPDGHFAAGMNAKGEFLSWGFTTRLHEPTKRGDKEICCD
jgi:hypothetical protein